jgi:hypothetical protein
MPLGTLNIISAYFGVTNYIYLILLNLLFIVGYIISSFVFALFSKYIRRWLVLIGTFLNYLIFILAYSSTLNYPALLIFYLLCRINAAALTSILGRLYTDIFNNILV